MRNAYVSSVLTAILVALPAFGQADSGHSPLPKEVANELGLLVGKWEASGQVAGSEFTGTWSARWSPEKHCLIVNYAITQNGEQIRAHGLFGWDSVTEEVVVVGFFSHNVMEHIRLKHDSPGLFKGDYKASGKGEPVAARCKLKITTNEWTFETTGMTRGGEQVDELKVRFVRQDSGDAAEVGP